MTKLFFLSESFPLGLDFSCLIAPLFADNLGDLWVGEARILRDDFGLMMLAVEDEGSMMSAMVTINWTMFGELTVTRSWNLRVRLADTDVCG